MPLTAGANIDNAISDGEDYELLFAISPRDRARLERELAKKIPQSFRSLGSAFSLNVSTTQHLNFCPVATFISNSPGETESFGRQFAGTVEAVAM